MDMQSKEDKKYTILVSGASGIVGYGILKSLRERGDCFLIGTTIYPVSPANCFSDIVKIVPKTDDPGYIDFLKSLIREYSVDMIIPAIEADMKSWNINREALEKTGTFVMLNTPSLVNRCLDKWLFYSRLEEAGYEGRIRTVIEREKAEFDLPWIIKPRCGFGARGVELINSPEQLQDHEERIGSELMIQEYVGTSEEEYTVSAFFDRDSGMKAVMAMRRKLAKAGFTEMAEVVDAGEFLNAIRELAGIFKPVGPTNFQFRKHNGGLKLLEINPRISSSTSLRTKFGYNECSMTVDYFLDHIEITQPEIRKGSAIRYTEDFIFYDSDNI